MVEHDWLEQLRRARILYATPCAMQMLLSLRGSAQLSTVVPSAANPAQVAHALQLLTCLDMIRTQPASSPTRNPTVSITPRGSKLARLISEADDTDRILLTTPCAAEILLGLRRGLLPAEAVPRDTDPHTIADAVELLERMNLIRQPPLATRRT